MTNPRIDIPAPPGLSYLPHQVKGIHYALGGRGTIFADEMGLGKTVEAIGVINATPDPGTLNVLIICPAGLKLTWWEEIDKWLVTSCKISVASYHETKAIEAALVSFDVAKRSIDILIVDEAQYIKNPEAQRSKNVERIALHAKRVLLLSGTPMENCPIELWQLLKIACPEKWTDTNPRIASYTITTDRRDSHPGEGVAFWLYAERYCALHKVTYAYAGGTRSAFDFGGASNLEELGKKLRATCMVRRLKKDVLGDLPDKRRQLVVIESKADDWHLYPELCEETYFDVLRKLRADKVAFADWSRRRHEQALAKVDHCIRFIGDALDETKKLIVFAHHSDVIANLRIGIDCELDGNEYSTVITGKTSMADRQAAVNAFQNDPLCRVIIGSIGAMGVGWTLTAADHIVFVELDPVPGRLSQAEDRAHRIGQKQPLLIQHLVANGSLCARMAKLVVKKQAVLSAVLDRANAELVFRESSENDE